MAALSPSITKRARKRRLKSGVVVVQTRFVLSFREPRTGRRKQLFFQRYKDAVAKRNALLTSVLTGAYCGVPSDLTVAQAVEHWLENRRGEVESRDVGRVPAGEPLHRRPSACGHEAGAQGLHSIRRERLQGAQLIEMLGSIRTAELSTANIRNWHKTLSAQISGHSADLAKKLLRAVLALIAEDFNLRVPPMPSKLGRGRPKPKKAMLTLVQIRCLLKAAVQDDKGHLLRVPVLDGCPT